MKTLRLPTPRAMDRPRSRFKDEDWETNFQTFEFHYRRLFETAQHGILILDAESGKITDTNPFAVALLGYPFEELYGRELGEIGLYEEIAASRLAFAELREARYSREGNVPFHRKDGEVIAVEIVSNIYRAGTQELVQCTIRAVNGQNKNSAAALAARASRAQQAWLLAHTQRLRTPLTEIAWMLGLMELEQRVAPQPRSPFDRAALRHVRRNLHLLIRSFNHLSEMTGQGLLWLADIVSPDEKENPSATPIAGKLSRITKPATDRTTTKNR